MTQQHPITPPPELVQQWRRSAPANAAVNNAYERHIATQAAQWGADQELLACGNYLKQCAAWEEEDVTEFYNYRRPKPPSLKEQALALLDPSTTYGSVTRDTEYRISVTKAEIIRRALEQLDA
jgi:hypothetical protein